MRFHTWISRFRKFEFGAQDATFWKWFLVRFESYWLSHQITMIGGRRHMIIQTGARNWGKVYVYCCVCAGRCVMAFLFSGLGKYAFFLLSTCNLCRVHSFFIPQILRRQHLIPTDLGHWAIMNETENNPAFMKLTLCWVETKIKIINKQITGYVRSCQMKASYGDVPSPISLSLFSKNNSCLLLSP